jgi:hypothetical protein
MIACSAGDSGAELVTIRSTRRLGRHVHQPQHDAPIQLDGVTFMLFGRRRHPMRSCSRVAILYIVFADATMWSVMLIS